jgi:hypothetical protein
MKAIAAAALAAVFVVAAIPSPAADAANPSSSKASSYAPQSHSKRRVYGAPIQPPIMGYRKPAHHKQGHSKKLASKAGKTDRASAKHAKPKKTPKADRPR